MKIYIIYNYILYFFRLFSTIGYYKILNRAPCAIQYIAVYLFYILYCIPVNPRLLIHPPLSLW